MDYLTANDARQSGGLRLVLTGGLPAPWSEAAKGVFHARNVHYVPVLQKAGGANEEIVAWTGHRNAPTAMYNNEPARVSAVDMINLAQRLGSGPSLIPDGIDERVQMFGLINEIAGEQGLAWNARVIMFSSMIENMGEEAMTNNPMLKDYHYRADAATAAPGKIIEVLNRLSACVQGRNPHSERYLVGNRLSALDIYWACFSQMLDPLPAEVNPMPDYLRDAWGITGKAIRRAGYELDPQLLEQRDYIFPKHLQWPLDY